MEFSYSNGSQGRRTFVSCVLICLVIGFAYCWSIFEKALVMSWGWTNTQASLPYSVFMFFYAASILLGGILQDRFGARKVCRAGMVILLCGLAIAAASHSVMGITIGFGVLAGSGQAMCYSCVISTPQKWAADNKRGLVSGFTVGAVGMTGIYLNPVIDFCIRKWDIHAGFLVMLVLIALVTIPCSRFVEEPPKAAVEPGKKTSGTLQVHKLLIKPAFYGVFFITFSCSLYGQIIVGHIANIAYVQAAWEAGFYLTMMLSVSNCLGRFLCGILSDYIPGPRLMCIIYGVGAANILLFTFYHSIVPLMIGTALVGFGYGASHSVMPGIIAHCFGAEHFGQNFGFINLAAGIAGVVGPLLAGSVIDANGHYTNAYLAGAACLIAASFIAAWIQKKFWPR